jgi:hypothetical protein
MFNDSSKRTTNTGTAICNIKNIRFKSTSVNKNEKTI